MTEQKTCEQRIDDHMKDRLEWLNPDMAEWNDDKIDEHTEEIYDSILSIETRKTYRVCLSWGGPADYFEFDFDAEGELIEGRYLFQDWYDGATRKLESDMAEHLIHKFAIGPEYEG